MDATPCPICAKQAGRGDLVGPVIHRDDLIQVSHRPGATLGYAFVETRRHVASLDLLTDAEAAAVGRAVSRLARGLRAELAADFVHAMVAGLAVPHFHEHVFVRHHGTPAALGWSEPWADAPTGDTDALARRLRPYLDAR